MVWETLWKQPTARWQQTFSNASDSIVFPWALLENYLKIHVLLAGLAVAVASVVTVESEVAVAVTSLNYLKIHLWVSRIKLAVSNNLNLWNV